jgi:hypothetical protein
MAEIPEPDKFDPMVEPWWTLAMAAAWIIWRRPNAVRQAWPKYRNEVEKPIDEPIRGADLFQARIEGKQTAFGPVSDHNRGHLPEVTLFDVLVAYDQDTSLMTGEQARLEMWRRLGAGELPAVGIPQGSIKQVSIRASEWVELDHFDNEKWQVDDIGTNYSEIRLYSKVRVRSACVVELWPPADAVNVHDSLKKSVIRAAIKELRVPDLDAMTQKERESRIIDAVKKNSGLTVTDRYIRVIWKEEKSAIAREGTTRCS